jgi:hypothetical protein
VSGGVLFGVGEWQLYEDGDEVFEETGDCTDGMEDAVGMFWFKGGGDRKMSIC